MSGKYLLFFEFKLKPKENDILGTQLADLLAYPSKHDVLCRNSLMAGLGAFSSQVVSRIASKYLDNGAVLLRG